VNTSNCYRDAR